MSFRALIARCFLYASRAERWPLVMGTYANVAARMLGGVDNGAHVQVLLPGC